MTDKDTIRAAAVAAYFIAGECYDRSAMIQHAEWTSREASWFNQYVGALRVAMKLEASLA